MTASSITRALAEAIIAVTPAATSRQRLLLELLRLLPLYRDIGNVAIWDKTYHAAMPVEDDTSDAGQLIGAVYEFATTPFYGAFEADVTLSVYQDTCRYLRSAGISCPAVNAFTDL
jgi:hypothetical protein